VVRNWIARSAGVFTPGINGKRPLNREPILAIQGSDYDIAGEIFAHVRSFHLDRFFRFRSRRIERSRPVPSQTLARNPRAPIRDTP
jgi:hypothetical protein